MINKEDLELAILDINNKLIELSTYTNIDITTVTIEFSKDSPFKMEKIEWHDQTTMTGFKDTSRETYIENLPNTRIDSKDHIISNYSHIINSKNSSFKCIKY